LKATRGRLSKAANQLPLIKNIANRKAWAPISGRTNWKGKEVKVNKLVALARHRSCSLISIWYWWHSCYDNDRKHGPVICALIHIDLIFVRTTIIPFSHRHNLQHLISSIPKTCIRGRGKAHTWLSLLQRSMGLM
jgi:hypothetical protein